MKGRKLPWLVNHHTDVNPFKSFASQCSEKLLGRCTVQSRCRFIQYQKRRLHNHLQSNINSFPLASRDSSLFNSSYQRVPYRLKPQGFNNSFNNQNSVWFQQVHRKSSNSKNTFTFRILQPIIRKIVRIMIIHNKILGSHEFSYSIYLVWAPNFQ